MHVYSTCASYSKKREARTKKRIMRMHMHMHHTLTQIQRTFRSAFQFQATPLHQNNASPESTQTSCTLEKSTMMVGIVYVVPGRILRYEIYTEPLGKGKTSRQKTKKTVLTLLLPQLICTTSYGYTDKCRLASRINGITTRLARSFCSPTHHAAPTLCHYMQTYIRT